MLRKDPPMIKKRHTTLYSLTCDNCGNVFEDPITDWVEYEDEDMLESDAEDYGWISLHHLKKTLQMRNDKLHFCCKTCRKEYLATKGQNHD